MAFVPAVSSAATEGLQFRLRGQSVHVVRGPAGELRIPVGPVGANAVHLGILDGQPCFAEVGDADAGELVPLRALFGAVPDDVFAVAARALGLLQWDADHRFCGRCGASTERSTVERVRACRSCGHGAYPRLSPAVIVLVERDGRALLARNPRFPLPFFSTLAGFVEVGESLEETVVREVREEVGVEVGDVTYFGSQPWPFSGSLMVGFTARWREGELNPDPAEVAEAGWFAPDALPTVPPPLSIARALIDDFVRRAR